MAAFVHSVTAHPIGQRTVHRAHRLDHYRSVAHRPCVYRQSSKPIRAAEANSGAPFLDGSKLRIGIVSSRFLSDLVNSVVKDCRDELQDHKVRLDNTIEVKVAGGFEAPAAAQLITMTQKVDAVIVVSVLVDDASDFVRVVAESAVKGLQSIQLQSGVPMVLGILFCKDRAEAEALTIGEYASGKEWARTAVEMALFRDSQRSKPSGLQVGFV